MKKQLRTFVKHLKDYYFYRIWLPKPKKINCEGSHGKEEFAQNSGVILPTSKKAKNSLYCRQFRGYEISGNTRIIWYLYQGTKQIGFVTVVYRRGNQYGFNNSLFEWEINEDKIINVEITSEHPGIFSSYEILKQHKDRPNQISLNYIALIQFAEKIS